MNQDSNLYELKQLFPQVDQGTLQQVYHQAGRNFETAYKKLDQIVRYNTERNALARVSPERKLTFLRMAFDKLNPMLIQNILQRWQWSVEGALDDILKAEDERDRQEQAIRRAQEEERRRRELERLHQLEEQRKATEKQNQVLFFVSMFPGIPQGYIVQTLEHAGWNGAAAFPILENAENMRRQQEESQRREEERLRHLEEERRRMEEMARFEEEAQKMIEKKLPDLLQCQNWDEISRLVEEPQQQLVQPGKSPLDAEQAAMVRVAATLNPKLTPAAIKKIFDENAWDVDKALLVSHAKSFQDAFERMVGTFPTIPREEVQTTLRKYFPSEGDAMKDLQPSANDIAEEKLLRDGLKHAEELLDEAKRQWGAWDAEKKDMMRKRSERRAQLEAATSDEERQFITIVDEMQTQKENLTIQTNEPKYQDELNKRLARVQEIRSQIDALHLRRKQRIEAQARQPATGVQARDLRAQFDVLLQEELKQIEAAQQSKDTDKMSIVAKRLREKIGDSKFAELQGAIGRAPGGHYAMDGSSPAKRGSVYAAPGMVMAEIKERRMSGAILPPGGSAKPWVASSPALLTAAPGTSATSSSSAPAITVPQMASGPLTHHSASLSPSSASSTSVPRAHSSGYSGFNPFFDLPGVPDPKSVQSISSAPLASKPTAPSSSQPSSLPPAPEHVPVPSFAPAPQAQAEQPQSPQSDLADKFNLAPHSSFGATPTNFNKPLPQPGHQAQPHPQPLGNPMTGSVPMQQQQMYPPLHASAPYGQPMQQGQPMGRPMYSPIAQPHPQRYPPHPGTYQQQTPHPHGGHPYQGHQQPMYQAPPMYYSNVAPGPYGAPQPQHPQQYPPNAYPMQGSSTQQHQQPRGGYPGSYGQPK